MEKGDPTFPSGTDSQLHFISWTCSTSFGCGLCGNSQGEMNCCRREMDKAPVRESGVLAMLQLGDYTSQLPLQRDMANKM